MPAREVARLESSSALAGGCSRSEEQRLAPATPKSSSSAQEFLGRHPKWLQAEVLREAGQGCATCARRPGSEGHARGFTSWGQFMAMLFCRVGRAHFVARDLWRFRVTQPLAGSRYSPKTCRLWSLVLCWRSVAQVETLYEPGRN
jgi:hypothetical protein